MCAADSLQHGSMTLQARDGPVTLMPSSGAQMGFTLAPRDFNDCFNPQVDQWRQNLRTVDCTTAWLDAVNPCDPSRRVVDLSSATFRIQIFAAPPSVVEVVFKMDRAYSLLEESLGEGDWTLNASKTANVIMMRGRGSERHDHGADRQAKRAARCGLLGGTPSRTLPEGEWKILRQTLEGERERHEEDGDNAEDSGRQRYRRGSNDSCSSPSCKVRHCRD